MNALPLHPAIVHVPLGLAVVAPLLAVAMTIAIRRGALPRASWLVVVGVQALLFCGALAALGTGEQDEERVEERVAERVVERHEASAERFVWSAGATLAVGTAVLLLRSNPATATLMAATSLATVVTAGVGLQVGHTGGAIVHGPSGAGATADAAAHAAREPDDD
jgi:uncharacterized membrane protein